MISHEETYRHVIFLTKEQCKDKRLVGKTVQRAINTQHKGKKNNKYIERRHILYGYNDYNVQTKPATAAMACTRTAN
jgi:hypothetical protein